jgi:hypothetical protein
MGLLGTNPLYGALYESQPTGILSQPQPQGLLGAATVNPLMARQIAAQRAANPRPDVTDIFGYGPTWQTYLQNMNTNLQAQLPQMDDSGAVMAQKAAGMLGNFAPFGMTVFHGSPHRFDKFDMSKIGTGEGAQAYGHGLYFAENPAVAKGYADQLTGMRVDAAKRQLQSFGGDIDQAISSVRGEIDSLKALPNKGGDPERWARQLSIKEEKLAELNSLKAGGVASQPNLYKVDLPDEQVAKMLDWDKPLNQQPETVRNALESAYPGSLDKYGDKTLQSMFPYGGVNKAVAENLRAAGIPGIKYLDGGSRTGGKGTSNFVVFDDRLPKIVGRE